MSLSDYYETHFDKTLLEVEEMIDLQGIEETVKKIAPTDDISKMNLSAPTLELLNILTSTKLEDDYIDLLAFANERGMNVHYYQRPV